MTEQKLDALEKRVVALEKKLAEREPPTKDWRSNVGMFDDEPEFMQQVIAEALALRETERVAAREEVQP